MADSSSLIGRPRDQTLDGAIVEATLELLNEQGFDGVSVAGVAERAGTTRPAIYRRYASKAEMVVAALASLGDRTRPDLTGDHLDDLISELRAFRSAITHAQSVSLVGSMLLDSVDHAVRDAYRSRVVQPRRERITSILAAAHAAGELTGTDRERAIAVAMCTGSWYAMALAGTRPPRDWPERTAKLVWRALGGS